METQYLIKNKIIQVVLIMLLLLFTAIALGVLYNTIPKSSLYNAGVILSIVFVLFAIMKLELKIENEVFYYRVFPFHLSFRAINIKDIALTEKYPFVNFRYAGIGIRKLKDGWAYFIDGNDVIKLHLSNGKKLYFTIKNIKIAQVAVLIFTLLTSSIFAQNTHRKSYFVGKIVSNYNVLDKHLKSEEQEYKNVYPSMGGNVSIGISIPIKNFGIQSLVNIDYSSYKQYKDMADKHLGSFKVSYLESSLSCLLYYKIKRIDACVLSGVKFNFFNQLYYNGDKTFTEQSFPNRSITTYEEWLGYKRTGWITLELNKKVFSTKTYTIDAVERYDQTFRKNYGFYNNKSYTFRTISLGAGLRF